MELIAQSLFFFAFLPRFVPAHPAGELSTMLTLSGVFMAMTFAVFVVYGFFAAPPGRQVAARPANVCRHAPAVRGVLRRLGVQAR